MWIEKSRLREILNIAVPIMLGMVSQNLLNLIDTAFVGRLGDASLAAVGMGGFANWLLVSFLTGLGAGVQATASRRLGEGKLDQTAAGLNAALLIAIVIGIPAAILGVSFADEVFILLNDDPEVQRLGSGYLEARFIATPFVAANFAFRGFWNGTKRAKTYLYTLVVMHAVNIFLDYALIFGAFGFPELGVAGAGYATTISLFVGTGIYIAMGLRLGRDNGFLKLSTLKEVLRPMVRLSIPAGFQQLFFSAGFVVFFVIAGKVGTDALAASNVLVNLLLVCVLPGVGIGLAGATLVGQAMGAGNIADARRWGWESVRFGALVMGSLGMILVLGHRVWLGIFLSESPSTLELAVLPLILLGLAQVLDGVGIVLLNVLVGVGDTMATLRINIFAQWILFLPLAWIFAVHFEFGIIALWVGMIGYRLVLALLVSLRFSGTKWTLARA